MKIDLLTGWEMRWTEPTITAEMAEQVSTLCENWMQVDLPCDIHEPLNKYGWIRDPSIADYSEDGLIYRDKAWWFRKKFLLTDEMYQAEKIHLVCQSLDAHAEIFLNGTKIGRHESAFFPYKREIGSLLDRENTLLIRLSSGEGAFSEKDIEPFKGCISEITGEFPDSPWIGRGDLRRVCVRKSQFSYGWDWSPPVPSCGILGHVFLQTSGRVTLRAVRIVIRDIRPEAKVTIEAEIDNHHDIISGDARLSMRVIDPQGNCVEEITSDLMVRSGLSWHEESFFITDPKIWWCNGMGEQPLYTVICTLNEDEDEQTISERFGIRTIRLIQEPCFPDMKTSAELNIPFGYGEGEQERLFVFELNGVRLFAKGANWVPLDPILSRVTDTRRRQLIQEAAHANFNMLRVWGGGIYEADAFYDACDESGILIWQDFMFACALYPDRQEWFLRQVEQEADYQTRRLRNHACMALWCGCNENFWFFDRRYIGSIQPEYLGGTELYNRLLPRVVQTNCSEIPYVNGSPYGGRHPNNNVVGDTHHWDECMMSPVMEDRVTPEKYDLARPKFVSEYGHIGPPCIDTMRTATNMLHPDLSSRVWNMHVNPFEGGSVQYGIRKHFGSVRGDLTPEKYCMLGGLLQGLMLGYSLDSFRISQTCYGSLFWMFADCWGEVGWSIVDNLLRRKPAWYYVKRSFRNLRLILREANGHINMHLVNDTPIPHEFRVTHGWMRPETEMTSSILVVTVAPYTRKIVMSYPIHSEDMMESHYYAICEEDLAVLRNASLGEFPDAGQIMRIVKTVQLGSDLLVTLESDAYVYGVHFDIGPDIHADDMYFEMLPGHKKTIRLYGVAGREPVEWLRVGSAGWSIALSMLKGLRIVP